jgi:uncharacterized protein (TIGR00369 family)
MSEIPSVEDVQKLLSRGPYHQWLGLKVVAVGDGTIEMTATWREEWVVNPDRGYLAADWALVSKTGRGVPTIDLRVDYHRAAMPGELTVRGEIVNYGKQFSVAEAKVFDKDGRLLASGRGTYLTTPPA